MKRKIFISTLLKEDINDYIDFKEVDRMKTWRLALKHSFYVGGMTLFSTMATLFTISKDLKILDMKYAMIAGIISMGLSFFTSMTVQNQVIRNKGNVSTSVQQTCAVRKMIKKAPKKIKSMNWCAVFAIMHTPMVEE